MPDPGPPLVPSQERLLLFNDVLRFAGRRPGALNLVGTFRVRGALDLSSMKQALDRLIARHVTLRTSASWAQGLSPVERRQFVESYARTGKIRSGLYVQTVHTTARGDLRTRDFRMLRSVDRDRRLSELLASEAESPFDLEQVPLIRLQVVTCAVDDHVIVLTVAHFAADAASVSVLWRDLFAEYTLASGTGREPLDPLALNFHDFVSQQLARRARGEFEDAASYWRMAGASLAGALLDARELDFARPATSLSPPGWSSDALCIEPEATSHLRRLARTLRTTPATIFLAALGVLLSRRSGRSVVAPSIPFLNRVRPGTQDLVGWLVNSHPVAMDFSSNSPVTDLLARCRSALCAALTHQEFSSQWLQDQGADPMPRTAMMFSFLRTSPPPVIPGLSVERLSESVETPATPGSGFDVRIIDDGTCFNVYVMNAAARFTRGVIPTVLEQYRHIVTTMSTHIDVPIGELISGAMPEGVA